MKTRFYLNGKRTTRKVVREIAGEERLKKMLAAAKAAYREDQLIQNDFFLGSAGMLTVEFVF